MIFVLSLYESGCELMFASAKTRIFVFESKLSNEDGTF